MLEWMAWTAPTAIFFAAIFLILCAMTVWQTVSPGVARKGFLPMPTTRGDRLFLGLLGSAYIHLAWLALVPEDGPSLWWAFGIAIGWMLAVMRFG